MDRILLERKLEIGEVVVIEGPPLEALLFRGGRPGGLVTLTDKGGKDYRGRVAHLSEGRATVIIFGVFPAATESEVEIILLQALPEKERMEWIIQKTAELGVSAVVPFKSHRSVSLEEREAKQRKSHRWQDIAVKAVQQSRRAKIPVIGPYRSFEDALEFSRECGLKLVLWEKEGECLKQILRPVKKVCVMVGPEGGFTPDEVASASNQGFVPIKLGQRILRTETAAITLVGILQYELGDIG